jgi:hypothetical protein
MDFRVEAVYYIFTIYLVNWDSHFDGLQSRTSTRDLFFPEEKPETSDNVPRSPALSKTSS